MVTFDIKVYFDTLCPWCYIGHKSLENAISLYSKTYPGGSKDDFQFRFLPYYINPNLPSPGIPWAEVVARKNGQDRVDAIRTRLSRVGRAHGIDFKFANVGNTRDSHRLVQYALDRDGGDIELQKNLVESIYRMHFEQSDTDVASHNDLTRAAVEVGLIEEEVREFLASDRGRAEVDEMVAKARADGVSSVPTVDINGVRVEGAEDVSSFYEAFVRVKEKSLEH